MQEFKAKAQENISSLNKQLQQAQLEAKTIKDEFDSYKEEMRDFESRLEELTVDKELAEAKLEEVNYDFEQTKEKLAEITLELDVLKGEVETNGLEGAASTFKSKQNDKEQEQLKIALIKYCFLNYWFYLCFFQI